MSTPTPLQFKMPDLLDVAVMVRQYEDLSEKGQAQMAPQLVDAFLSMLTKGRQVLDYMANVQSDTRPTDHALDRGWGGLDSAAEAFERLYADGPTPLTTTEKTQRERAATLRQGWVGSLSFLKLPFMEQWRESEQRLAALDRVMRTPAEGTQGETPRQALEALGLSWALERLQRLHDTYGRALGIHDTINLSATEVSAWETALDAFLAGLRFFHAQDPSTWDLLFAPYEAACERGKDRRRKANAPKTPGADA